MTSSQLRRIFLPTEGIRLVQFLKRHQAEQEGKLEGRTEPHVPKTKSKVQRQTKYAEKRSKELSPTLGEGAVSEPRDFHVVLPLGFGV